MLCVAYCPQAVLEEKEHCALSIVIPFVKTVADRSVGLQASFDLNWTSLQCLDSFNKALVDHRDVR